MSQRSEIMWRVLGAAVGLWAVLTVLALLARPGAAGLEVGDLDQAFQWGTKLLGLASTLGGLLGLTEAASKDQGLFSVEAAPAAEGGVIGVLTGATLLQVGGVAVPVALAAFIAGGAGARFVRAWKA
jgi:hypothetical protein